MHNNLKNNTLKYINLKNSKNSEYDIQPRTVTSTLKTYALFIPIIAFLVYVFSITIAGFSFGLNIFFINLFIQMPLLPRNPNRFNILKVIILPVFITALYYNKVTYFTDNNNEFIYTSLIIILNLVLLPFSQLWLQNINPYTHYNKLALQAWKNISNYTLVIILFLIVQCVVFIVNFFGDANSPMSSLFHQLLLMVCILTIFYVMERKQTSKFLFGFIVLNQFLFIIFGSISIIFTIIYFNDYDFMSHVILFFNFIFCLTLFLAQTFLLPHKEKTSNSIITPSLLDLNLRYVLIFMAICGMFWVILYQVILFINADLSNHLAPTVALRLLMLIFMGAYIGCYIMLFLVHAFKLHHLKLLFQNITSNNYMESSKITFDFSTILLLLLDRVNNISLFFLNTHKKINLIFLTLFIIFYTYVLSPFFNINEFLTQRHINRLFNHTVTIENFDFGLLEDELGDEGELVFDDLIQIAQKSGFTEMDELTRRSLVST